MMYCVSMFTICIALKSVYCSIASNLSSCNKFPEPNSDECLLKNVEVAFESLENYNPNLGLNFFDSSKDALKPEISSGPLNLEELVSLKLREHSCAKANEYIYENNCKVLIEEDAKKASSETKNKNNIDSDSEKDNTLSTTALYLYGWLAYRLIFVVLQQI